jgi:hypothetical protein
MVQRFARTKVPLHFRHLLRHGGSTTRTGARHFERHGLMPADGWARLASGYLPMLLADGWMLLAYYENRE